MLYLKVEVSMVNDHYVDYARLWTFSTASNVATLNFWLPAVLISRCSFHCNLFLLYCCRESASIQFKRKRLGVYIIHASQRALWSHSWIFSEWYCCNWSWSCCAEGPWLLVIWLKKRDWFCWTKEPRCYLLHEFSPANVIPHTLFQKGGMHVLFFSF